MVGAHPFPWGLSGLTECERTSDLRTILQNTLIKQRTMGAIAVLGQQRIRNQGKNRPIIFLLTASEGSSTW